MDRALRLGLLAVAACALAWPVSAQTYRWVDKDGKVHYTDHPPPPAEARSLERKRLDASVVESGAGTSFETRRAAADFPVTLYVAADCGAPCASGRQFLAARRIPYGEKSIATPADLAAYKKATGADALSLPTLQVGGKVQKGFQEELWGGLLEAAGYPR
jgi:hypothetical protein